MTSMVLKPAPGRTVRDPSTRRALAAVGEAKELDAFWLRRIAVGDVIEACDGDKPAVAIAASSTPVDLPESIKEQTAFHHTHEAGTPAGVAEEATDAQAEKTNSRRARRATKAED